MRNIGTGIGTWNPDLTCMCSYSVVWKDVCLMLQLLHSVIQRCHRSMNISSDTNHSHLEGNLAPDCCLVLAPRHTANTQHEAEEADLDPIIRGTGGSLQPSGSGGSHSRDNQIIWIRIRIFFSNLDSDSDSTIFEPEYYSNIRIFFLESRIFETNFSSQFWI